MENWASIAGGKGDKPSRHSAADIADAELMPSRKNQHFVPQMYLRLFANPDGRSIGMFNIERSQFIGTASIRDQASRNWFYGRGTEVEDSFGVIEGVVSLVLGEILRTDRVPGRLGSEHHALATFVSLQHARTAAAEAEFNERADKFAKSMLRHRVDDPNLLAALSAVKISMKDAILESVRMGHLATPLLYDLHFKLIKNVSALPFLTSDAPVIFHNRVYENRWEWRASGYANVGLQIVMPIGPWHALFFYDSTIYEVGSISSKVVRLVNPEHAALINDLQWEKALENLYVSPFADPALLCRDAVRWKSMRLGDRIASSEGLTEEGGSLMRLRVAVGEQRSQVALALPFVRERRVELPAWDPRGHPPSRHPEWADHISQLARSVMDGKLSFSEFSALTAKVPRSSKRRSRG